MSEELKPCPFCGGDNVKTFGPYGWYRHWGISHSCRSFYNGAQELAQGFHSQSAAIEAWNTRTPQWQNIATAPKDGTPILAACFNPPWSDSHLKGDIVQCWWEEEFEEFIESCREMSLAPGYTFEGGGQKKLHSPVIAHYRSHWMALPLAPTQD